MATPLSIAIGSLSVVANTLMEDTLSIDLCSIERPSLTAEVSEYGGVTADYATVSSGNGCTIEPVSETAAKEYMRALKIASVTTHKISMASTVDVMAQDRIRVEARASEPERVFEVIALIPNSGLPPIVLCTLGGS
jgi:head-tail adaptor